MKNYLIELNGISIKEYKRIKNAIEFAQQLPDFKEWGLPVNTIRVLECVGSQRNVIWENKD